MFEGMRPEVNECEDELTRLNQTVTGRRQIRQISKLIEEFRAELRLVDLEA